jgi:hypothetical protein
MGNSHKKTSCLEPVAQLEPNFDGIVIGWSSSKIVSGSHALPPRWPPQCNCVVIESSFDPGERLQAPGRLWLLQSTGGVSDSAIFQLYHGENKLIFNEMMMMSALY